MNVLLINNDDGFGGAAKAACRLLGGVRQTGVSAHMRVRQRGSGLPAVNGPTTGIAQSINRLRPYMDKLPLLRFPHRQRVSFSPAVVPDLFCRTREVRQADLLHLHWVGGGAMRIESLARFDKPMVWTMHDSWPFTGGCHVPHACHAYRECCGCCPILGSNRGDDLSRRIWRRKQQAWARCDLTLVAPSRWLAARANSSSLFCNRRIEVIPNGLDPQVFRPFNAAEARMELGLPLDRPLILAGGMGLGSDLNKGGGLLREALVALMDAGYGGCELVVAGALDDTWLSEMPVPVHPLGHVHDEEKLRQVYAAADVFVCPSMMENLSNMIMEAMACGTPCVAFGSGGTPDLVEHSVNGYLARPYDPGELAAGLEWVLSDSHRTAKLGEKARKKVVDNFGIEAIAMRYFNLYEEILASKL